ncbi:MAG: metallophosphoesterase family protein [Peptostreptococcaceae bacterium]
MHFKRISKVLTALTLVTVICFGAAPQSLANQNNKDEVLKFENGNFKVVQFTDTQDGPNTDERTIQLMNDVLDKEDPNLVLITGDVIDGRSNTKAEVKKAIDNVVKPMEDRDIPWAITFGNHDEDHTSKTGMDKEDMMKYYMSFEDNVNVMGSNVSQNRVGDGNLTIKNTKGNKDIFNLYLFDSGTYANKDEEDLSGYAYVTPQQIAWYRQTSDMLAKKNKNQPLPSLAFMHIPVPEYTKVLLSGGNGSWNESPCPSNYNSGLFMAMKEKKDVQGIYVGHDHINDFERPYAGVNLGYAANTGYGTYGLSGDAKDNMRGARVFEISESNPNDYTSRMVYHKDIQDNIVSPSSVLSENENAETVESKQSIVNEQ